MSNDNDVIVLSDSPLTPRASKRKREAEPANVSPVPKHPLLESIGFRFKQNRDEREAKVAEFHSKREAEKVHSEYLKKYETCPRELARAGYAAGHWAKKNGMKVTMPRTAQSPLSLKARGTSSVKRENLVHSPIVVPDSPEVSSASCSNHTDTSPKDLVCPILYCDAKFTSVAKLEHHMNLFEHSPCNPCRLITDVKLKPDPCCYKCPLCDLEFSSYSHCKDHMLVEQHLKFMTPLSITAFMCSQCLCLFDTFESCLMHIEQTKHFSVCLPFSGDNLDDGFSLPVPVSEEFVQDFICKCRGLQYEVRCLQCELVPRTPRNVRDHMHETRNQHTFSAFTECSLHDIFSQYLASYSCNVCQRLFHSRDESSEFHDCADGIMGCVEEGAANTFAELIKRCSLTLRKSYREANVVCIDDDIDTEPLDTKPDVQDIIYASRSGIRLVKTEFASSEPTLLKTESAGLETPMVKTESNSLEAPFVKTEFASMESPLVRTESTSFEIPLGKTEINRLETPWVKTEPTNLETHLVRTESINLKMPLVKTELSECDDRSRLNDMKNFDLKSSPESQLNPIAGINEEHRSDNSSIDTISLFQNFEASGEVDDPRGKSKKSKKKKIRLVNKRWLDLKPSARRSDDLASSRVVGSREASQNSRKKKASVIRYEQMLLHQASLSNTKPNTAVPSGACSLPVQSESLPESKHDVISQSLAMLNRERTEPTSNYSSGCSDFQTPPTINKVKTEPVLKVIKENSDNVNSETQYIPHVVRTETNMFATSSKTTEVVQTAPTFSSETENIRVISPAKEKSSSSIVPASSVSSDKPNTQMKVNTATTCAMNSCATNNKTLQTVDSVTGSTSGKTKGKSKMHQKTANLTASTSTTAPSQTHVANDFLTSFENLQHKKNIIFLDLDNYPSFFFKLPHCPSSETFVWMFYGAGTNINSKRIQCPMFKTMQSRGMVYIHEQCGRTKDAADFALVLTLGKLDVTLPSSVSFTILSADKGFCEVERQMENSGRKAMVINQKNCDDHMLLGLLASIAEM